MFSLALLLLLCLRWSLFIPFRNDFFLSQFIICSLPTNSTFIRKFQTRKLHKRILLMHMQWLCNIIEWDGLKAINLNRKIRPKTKLTHFKRFVKYVHFSLLSCLTSNKFYERKKNRRTLAKKWQKYESPTHCSISKSKSLWTLENCVRFNEFWKNYWMILHKINISAQRTIIKTVYAQCIRVHRRLTTIFYL